MKVRDISGQERENVSRNKSFGVAVGNLEQGLEMRSKWATRLINF
jgi:hypothetical protein